MARTLAQILDDCLPEVGRTRLSDAFWISKANFVLDGITTKLEGPFRTVEVMVPLVAGVTMYRIPSSIRRVERVRYPAGHLGVVLEDPATYVSFSIVGDFIRISEAPTIDANVDLMTIQGLSDIPSHYELQKNTIQGAGLDWPDIVGRAMTVLHYDVDGVTVLSTESAIIATVTGTSPNYNIRINGEFVDRVKYGDRADITSNFIILTGSRALRHFTTISSESPLPGEFDRALASGLRFYLELQQDEDGTGPSVAKFDEIFRRDIEEIQADFTRFSGDNYPVQPQNSVMFNGLRRR